MPKLSLKLKLLALIGLIGLAGLSCLKSSAPAIAANIGNTSGYAWSEALGWIRFDGTDSAEDYGVTAVTDGSGLAGYAWGENTGYISMAGSCSEAGGCPEGGDTYAVSGNTTCAVGWTCLSGYAYSDTIGWIKFAADGTNYANTSTSTYGVYINADNFYGYAYSDEAGWISLNGSCAEAGGCPGGGSTYGPSISASASSATNTLVGIKITATGGNITIANNKITVTANSGDGHKGILANGFSVSADIVENEITVAGAGTTQYGLEARYANLSAIRNIISAEDADVVASIGSIIVTAGQNRLLGAGENFLVNSASGVIETANDYYNKVNNIGTFRDLTGATRYTCEADSNEGDAVYVSGDSAVTRADADSLDSLAAVGFITKKISATACLIKTSGRIYRMTNDASGALVPGNIYYLSATAGKITTAPATGYLRIAGVAASANVLEIKTSGLVGSETIYANSAQPALSIVQAGTGDLLRVYDGSDQVFTIIDGGNIGIGTTTPAALLSIGANSGNQVLINANGQIIGGEWMGDPVADGYIASAVNWNNAYAQVNASSTFWNQAYEWVNAGRTNWDNAYSWGDHTQANYFATSSGRILETAYGGTGTTTLDNLITLGIHTIGDYISSTTGSDTITITGTPGEGWIPVFSVTDDSITASKLAVGSDGTSGYVLTAVGDGTFAWSEAGASSGYVKDSFAGQLAFYASDGIVATGTTGLYWDNENARLGIGTTTPNAALSIGVTLGNQFLVGADGIITDGEWNGDIIADVYLASSTYWNAAYQARIINTTAPITFSGNTIGLDGLYNIPLIASTTQWNDNYNLVNSKYANWDDVFASSSLFNWAYNTVNTNYAAWNAVAASSTYYDQAYNWGNHAEQNYFSTSSARILEVAYGGTGSSTLAVNGVLYGNGTNAVNTTGQGIFGMILMVDQNGIPVWAATSSLGIDFDAIGGIVPISQGGTGATTLDDLIELGTQTTGNYISSTTGSDTITILGTPGEGWVPVFSVTDDSITASKLAVGSDGASGFVLTSDGDGTFSWSEAGASSGQVKQSFAGQLAFFASDGVVATGTTNLFWDNDNYRLGIGTTTPGSTLSIGATVNNQFLVNANGLITDGEWNGDIIDDEYIASSTYWNAAYFGRVISATAPLTFTGNTIGLDGLYNIPLIASTTNWEGAYTIVNSKYANWDAVYASSTFFNTNSNIVNLNYLDWNAVVSSSSLYNWAYNIVNSNYANWDTAFGWGDHSLANYFATGTGRILEVAYGGTGQNTLNDLITLGTHTTGNYISSTTGSNTITITGTPGEGWVPVFSVTDDSITAAKIAVTGNGAVGQVLVSDADGTFSWSDAGATSGSVKDGLAGQLAFYATNGIVATGTTNLYWDNNNYRLGIGTTTPGAALSIGVTTGSQFLVSSNGLITDGTWNGDIIDDDYIASSTFWNAAYLTRVQNVTAPLTFTGNTIGLDGNYNIPLIASTTNWEGAYKIINSKYANWDAVAASSSVYNWAYNTVNSNYNAWNAVAASSTFYNTNSNIVNSNYTNWNTAYTWGDHEGLYDAIGQATSTLNYHLGTYSHASYDAIVASSTVYNWAYNTVNSNYANWNTAFGWGNHAAQNYFATGTGRVLEVAYGGTGTTTLNNLIALGTHTTGIYISSTTGSNTITITGTPGEGWVPVFSVTDNSITAAELAVSGNGPNGYVLVSNGDGTFSWSEAGASSGSVQYSLAGQLAFFAADGIVATGTTNLYWDNNNYRLGIGTTTPGSALSIGVTTGDQFLVSANGIITDGTWNGDDIDDEYIASSTFWNAAYFGRVLSATAPLTFTGNTIGLDGLYNIPLISSTTNWNTAYAWGDHAGLYDILGQATSTLNYHLSEYNHTEYDDVVASSSVYNWAYNTVNSNYLSWNAVTASSSWYNWAYNTVNSKYANWDTAFGWGDHAGLYDVLGQATSTLAGHTAEYNHDNYDSAYTEVNASSTYWNQAYLWGNHAAQNYFSTSTGNVLEFQYGGTGISSITNQSLLFASADNVLSEFTVGEEGEVLIVSGGNLAWASTSPAAAHRLLSVAHSDVSATSTLARGDLLIVDSDDNWNRMALGPAGYILYSNGIDAYWATTTSITALGEIIQGSWKAEPIALAYGGTGATTATGARENLDLDDMYEFGINSTGTAGWLWQSDGDGRGQWVATSSIGLNGVAQTHSKFIGTTTITSDGHFATGTLDGYAAGNAICDDEYPGSYFCRTYDILVTVEQDNISGWGDTNADAWIAQGPPGFTDNSNDCNGWNTNDIDYLGAFWVFNGDTGGYGKLVNCTQVKPLACCKWQ